jgi:hypothetical protein
MLATLGTSYSLGVLRKVLQRATTLSIYGWIEQDLESGCISQHFLNECTEYGPHWGLDGSRWGSRGRSRLVGLHAFDLAHFRSARQRPQHINLIKLSCLAACAASHAHTTRLSEPTVPIYKNMSLQTYYGALLEQRSQYVLADILWRTTRGAALGFVERT